MQRDGTILAKPHTGIHFFPSAEQNIPVYFHWKSPIPSTLLCKFCWRRCCMPISLHSLLRFLSTSFRGWSGFIHTCLLAPVRNWRAEQFDFSFVVLQVMWLSSFSCHPGVIGLHGLSFLFTQGMARRFIESLCFWFSACIFYFIFIFKDYVQDRDKKHDFRSSSDFILYVSPSVLYFS